MTTVSMIAYEDATPEVRDVYDDIMATRSTDWINNFWKTIAGRPELLKRTWEGVKSVMGPGALDPLVKELIYIAVSATNGCPYCVNSHTASARQKGMTEAMLSELMDVVGMANQTNALASGYQVAIDEAFRGGGRPD
ncbi:MAG: carboxymuconolactone decarboxylase family protein [Desulfobacterales bacterium]|jgi:AhpD family alkylhydroperoxidase